MYAHVSNLRKKERFHLWRKSGELWHRSHCYDRDHLGEYNVCSEEHSGHQEGEECKHLLREMLSFQRLSVLQVDGKEEDVLLDEALHKNQKRNEHIIIIEDKTS